ncbi:MAG: FMN-dependent dehydrogenase family protein barrel family protein [Deltaproteobacteria bacterium]|nr:FMN-dependent dehydrogenase family protein barrel family protein [Deltaproteobacteria bacterium]
MSNPPESIIDLTGAREEAKERMKGVCAVYKVCDGHADRLCQGIKYGKALGMGGIGKGLTFAANIEALDRLHLKSRLISSHSEPEMKASFLGYEVAFPIFCSSMSGVKISMGGAISESDFARAVITGCKAAGTIGFIGDGAETFEDRPGVQAIREAGGWGVQIFKPREQTVLLRLIEEAQAAGATLPFILKGITSVEDAAAALETGCKVIAVSNHGGRTLDCMPGVADVLPRLVPLLRGKVVITADGGVRTGFDVLKMLALGADFVMVGREFIRAAIGGGAQGVTAEAAFLSQDLKKAMIMTGCNSLSEIDGHVFA